MNVEVVAILVISLGVQVAAVVLALRLLISRAGTPESRRAWLLISTALLLMAGRRAITLGGHFFPTAERPFRGIVAEIIALAIALLMLAGVVEIARVFRGMERNARDLKASIEEAGRSAEALRLSEEQLRHGHKMEAVGRLAGGVAHDFNNFLTVISGYTELLRKEPGLSPRAGGAVEEIKKAGDRAAALTRQLLAFSRKQVLAPEVLDLNLIVSDLDPMLRRLISADIELTTDLAGGLGSVKADPGQIGQVLMNLVVNARDAMPGGGKVTIATSNVDLDTRGDDFPPEMQPGGFVVLSVTDTGCGMAASTRGRIFEPFFTTKPKDKGTGLGLATVYGIVRQSGGHIRVETELGEGTSFTVLLPRYDAAIGGS